MNSDDTQQIEFPSEWEGTAGAALTGWHLGWSTGGKNIGLVFGSSDQFGWNISPYSHAWCPSGLGTQVALFRHFLLLPGQSTH